MMVVQAEDDIEFPEELKREIFEIAARLDRSVAASLLTVARRVYDWIKPLLYNVVIHENELPGVKHLTEEWYIEHGKHIHHLLIPSGDVQYIEHCPNLRNLAVWSAYASPEILYSLRALRLRRLSVEIDLLFGSAAVFQERVRASPPLFADLTHLEIVNLQGKLEDWRGIALLPKLTHLAIDEEPEGVLAHYRHLHVLVFVSENRQMPGGVKIRQRVAGEGEDQGDNVVHIEIRRYEADWEAGARGCLNMWSLADEIMEVRLRYSTVCAAEGWALKR